MLPDHIRQMAGIPKEIEIDGHKYKAYPLRSEETLEYYDMFPSVTKIDNGKPVIPDESQYSGKTMKAQAYAIFVTLQKQTPEMKNDTLDSFLKELDDAGVYLNSFVMNFSPLLEAVLVQDSDVIKKKD